jgi:uncharacterized protein YjbJ (UPF0337 family)
LWVSVLRSRANGYALTMNTTNKLNNKAQYWGGRAKETVGRVSGNRRTQFEGKLDQVKAKVKDALQGVTGSRRPQSGTRTR